MNPYVNVSKFERLKPGFSRLSLPWFAPDEEIEYILDALEMVSRDGWKLLPQYEFNSENGEWRHHSKIGATGRKWLNDIDFYKSVCIHLVFLLVFTKLALRVLFCVGQISWATTDSKDLVQTSSRGWEDFCNRSSFCQKSSCPWSAIIVHQRISQSTLVHFALRSKASLAFPK